MLSRILNRILSKITNEIREIAEFISLETNTSHSAIVNARNRRMMFNINFLKGNLKNANALWNGKTISARKELR